MENLGINTFSVLVFFFIFAITPHISQGIVVEGKCPRVSAVHVMEPMMAGTWYEIQRSRADVQYHEQPTTCTFEQFSFSNIRGSRFFWSYFRLLNCCFSCWFSVQVSSYEKTMFDQKIPWSDHAGLQKNKKRVLLAFREHLDLNSTQNATLDFFYNQKLAEAVLDFCSIQIVLGTFAGPKN